MNSPNQTRAVSRIRAWHVQALVICFLSLSYSGNAQILGQAPLSAQRELEPKAREQIRLLQQEKLSRTPAQQKIGSQLLYTLRQKRQGPVGFGLSALKPRLRIETDGRVLVDVQAVVSPALVTFIRANGGLVVNSVGRYGTLRALVPAELTELLAQRGDVRSIRPAARATTSAPMPYEGGDIAHRAAEARQFFSTDGTGVKVGVLSDSIRFLTNSQAAGALPAVTVLPGQEGYTSQDTGEGTAMLEIVHALAPGSPLYFATAFNSEASFAQNIRSLQAAGCKIIIDDVTYFDESPFQDGPIAQAVNDVSAAGTLYFSAAGNSGGMDRGNSGTWEGDFKDAGPSSIGQGGELHDFGGVTYNTVLAGIGFERLDLTWSDPLGKSANDYDVYVLDTSGNVVSISTDNQSGSTDPYESIDTLNVGERIVILLFSGTNRFLHLSTGRGKLAISTAGATYGHNASGAGNAFCVAAARVGSPPVPFVGGAANPVEPFCSDGPRRVFYNPDGSPITPGDFSSSGGRVLQKPDITAADGVNTTVDGFSPFSGTSAAAPHAGAIAALLWSYNPYLTPIAIRSLLTNTALTIGSPGYDRNSGAGIVMAYQALAAAPEVLFQSVQLQDGNHNGKVDPNECSDLVITLRNPTSQVATGITAVLTSSTPQVFVDPAPRVFPDLQPGQSAASTNNFRISTGPGYVCGSNAVFMLEVKTANLGNFAQPFELGSVTAGLGSTNTLTSTNVPLAIPDVGTIESEIQVSGVDLPLAQVRVSAYITHGYDQDLRISLVAPDDTEVVLSANNGSSGQDYGAGCNDMTHFSDDATNSISAAAAPFVGVFTPEQPLSTFVGKSGTAVNGLWRLRVDDQAPQDTGTIQCWSLELTPIGCFDGGGQCLSPPQFTQDLSDQVATNGGTVKFAVVANGTGPLAYQWYFNANTALPAETNAMLVLTNVSFAQAGTYQVVVTNIYGSNASSPANLTIVVPATIVTGPTNQVATNGETVILSVVASGTPPTSYQWFFNSTTVLGDQTNSSLFLTNVSFLLAGNYSVVVSNIYASVTSAPARLLVITPPTIGCSSNTSFTVGNQWTFSPPSYADTNLILNVLGTLTNMLCGESFSATRQWLISDTNGYQLTCSQTVDVLDTNPPIMSCPGDKTNAYGSAWSFDLPAARDAEAVEALVYDNWTNSLNQTLDTGPTEVGNQVTLFGTERYPSRFAIEYWGTNASQAAFAGAVTAQVRFYDNDGPALPTGEQTPGTVIYDSGPLPIIATNRGALVLEDFQLSAALPVAGALPATFTWTVSFAGLGSQDAAGIKLYGPPVVGQVASKYWVLGTGGWALQAGQGFGGQLAARSTGVSLTVLNTVTNIGCARSFTATRTWQAMDACSNLSICHQTVSVVDQSVPLVLAQPQSQAGLVGRSASLAVSVMSCPPIFYQWYFNQTNPLPQGTNATLVLTNLVAGQAGAYTVLITNTYGSVTSAPAMLTVLQPPVIVANPTDQLATNGDTVQWSITAQGSGSLSYQWYFNNTNPIPGGTNATLILTNVNLTQVGEYIVVVSDANGSTATLPARLQVVVLPTLVSIQSAFSIPDPGTVESRLRVQGMNSPLARVIVGVYITHTYDADLKISLLSPDGTEVVLSAYNGQSGQNYGADCVNTTVFSDTATNSIVLSSAPFVGEFEPQQPLASFIGKKGAAVNGLWTLRVQDQAPPNSGTLQCWSLELDPMGCLAGGGPCLIAPQITQDIGDQVVEDGKTAELSVAVQGADPLSYQWYFNATNALAQGTNAALILTNVGLLQAGTYQVVVTNVFGSATSVLANLSIIQPARIVSNPTDQVATNGDTVTWNVLAQGAAPLSYQWYFNSTNVLADETNSTLTLSNVSPAQNGSYAVVVSNVYASVTSAPATLLVWLLPRIVCSTNTTVGLDTSWDFTPPSYSDTNLTLVLLGTTTNALCGNSYSATRQWVVSDTNGYQVPCRQTVQVIDSIPPVINCPPDKTNVYGSNWNFDLPSARDAGAVEALVYDNWTNNLNQSLDPGPAEVGNQVTLALTERYPSRFAIEYWGTNAGQAAFAGSVTAQVRFYHNDGPPLPTGESTPGTIFYDSGPLAIDATQKGALVLQDFGLSALVPLIGALPSTFTWTVRFSGLGSQDAAGLNLYGPTVTGLVGAKYWSLSSNGWTLQDGQGFGGQLAALSRGASLSVLSTVTNAPCARTFAVTRTWQALDACDNSNSCSQTVTLVDQSAPLVIDQPQNQTALAGQTVSLAVNVSSCPPTSYQWYFNETNSLGGATNDTLVLTNIGSGQAGTYAVVITNTYGSITSAPATVIVQVPALIVKSPGDQVATNGDDVHWRVLAKGSEPLFYQWYFNATNALVGETNSALDLTNVVPAQSGTYEVVVTNIYGSSTSAPANLTIVVPPSIVTNPTNQVANMGDKVTWTVVAQGTAPLSYQWYFNSTMMRLETNAALVLTNVAPAQEGTYQVVVDNDFGSVTSAPATLKVIVIPQVVCSADITVPLGSPWTFSPPTYSDPNLTLHELTTTTNQLCGSGFSATRQWVVSDTNGFEVPCSQTVKVVDSVAPLISCSTNKTVLYGSSWAFDLPVARESGAVEALVYDNWTNSLSQGLDPGQLEVGNQITLAGTQRYASRLAFEYWGTNATQNAFAGAVTARVRFYQMNGPVVSVGVPSPGTVFYDSGPVAISATNRGAVVLQDFQLSAATPLQGALPSTFTWTVRFEGLGSQDAAGLNLFGPPVVGQAAGGYWASGGNGWTLNGQAGQSFGGQVAALSGEVNLSVVSTVTNVQCGRTIAVTRNWQALDSCINSATCSQTVTVLDQSPPLVVNQPQNQSVLVGQTVSLGVTVLTCPPTAYQWYFNLTNALGQGTNATLVLTNVTVAQAGSYEVIITNAYGSSTSAPAVVSISGAPLILSQPLDVAVTNGGTAVFTVSATGLPVPSYQWLFNDTNAIPGETNSSLTLTNVQNSEAGFYSVVVSNSVGALTSGRVALTVAEAPVITKQPQSLTVFEGQPAIFTVTAVGSAPLSYQWLANCTRPISGATTTTNRLKSASPSDSGSYCVVITNAFGSVFSQPAVLRVLAQAKLTSLTQTANGVSFSFTTFPNLLYSVYSSAVVPTTNWIPLPNAFQQPGTGAPMTVHDPAATGSQRFYRIVVE